MSAYDYIKDGTAIYERSFAIIRAEADLSRFSEAEADIALSTLGVGMLEVDQTIGGVDALRQRGARARGHREIDRHVEPARHVLIGLLVESELGGPERRGRDGERNRAADGGRAHEARAE